MSFNSQTTSIKFAIVTDTHLGYEENDPQLQNDSFEAFDEALDIAEKENVDFILHAGDMFNVLAPSPSTIVRTNEILLGHKYTIPNDASQENPYRCTDCNGDVEVKLPIFVISGNHDQPSGINLTSPCEIPSSCKLIYYFDKFIDEPKFVLKPVIIERGNIAIFIYGLTYINNEHFITILKNTKDFVGNRTLEFDNPPTEDSDSDFKRYNILLVHQDRPPRGNKNLESLHLLSKICPWMDLIVWGHEHDNKTSIERCYNLNVIQPGSTIITQLKKYDEPKRGIDIIELYSNQDDINFRNIELTTPRSYVYDELDLTKIKNFNVLETKAKENIIREKIEELIDQNTNQEKLPLIRLSIISSPSIVLNDVPYKQICYEFSEKVANPNSIINISKRKDNNNNSNASSATQMPNIQKGPDFNSSPSSVEESLSQSFSESPLEILLVDTLNKSLTEYINTGKPAIFSKNINDLIEDRVKYLVSLIPDDEEGLTPDNAAKFIDENRPNFPSFSISEHVTPPRSSRRKNNDDDDDDDDDSETTTTKSRRGRGGNGKGRGGRGGRKPKESKILSDDEIEGDSDNDEDSPPVTLPPKKTNPPRKKPSISNVIGNK